MVQLVTRAAAAINGDRVFLIGVASLIVYLTVVPIAVMIFGSVQSGLPGTWTAFTLDNYARAFSHPALYTAIGNSLIYSVGAGLISFVLGTALAWLTERTDMPFKGIVYASVLTAMMIPGVLFTISWILLLSPKAGLINVWLMELTGTAAAPFNPYSLGGMIFVSGIDDFYTPFLFMAAAFRSMDPSLEEASVASGASMLTTFFRVTLRLMLPAALAVALLIFIRGIEDFEVPALLGIPAGIYVMSTEIYVSVRRPPTDFNLAATFSMFYLLVALAGLYLYFKSTKMTEKFAVITGKGFRPSTVRLGAWRWPAFSGCLSIIAVTVYLPLAVLAWTSLLPWYQPPSLESLPLLTLKNFRWLFDDELIVSAVKNNFIVGVSAALIVTLFGAVVSWIVIRTRLPGRRILDGLAFSATAYPSMVLGLALVWFYLTVPIPIYGTLWILVVAYVTKRLPSSTRVCSAVMTQIRKELEEASEVCGASFLRTFASVVAPLLVPGLFVSFVSTLTMTFKALSLPVLLGHAGTELVPVLIFDMFESGRYPEVAALGCATIIVITAVTLLSRRVSQRFGLSAASG
ncbi:MAG TPA: iron ABC transporter permease [Candidatus Acidoferrales bacterium]|nr:iron ABC transporter permease [Candidatus Acidoferrales bacterium]